MEHAASRGLWRGGGSIRSRLMLSATLFCLIILLIAGVGLTAFYRRSTERGFDERLSVYVKELIADLASPSEEGAAPGTLGEPRFDLPLSGWYWQITRLDGDKPEIRASRSLVGGQLASLNAEGVPLSARGMRETYITGPDNRNLRAMERLIDVGEDGRFRIQVAGPSDEIEEDIRDFRYALILTFGFLGLALVGSALLQVRYALRPLKRLTGAIEEVRTGRSQHLDGAYPPDLAPLSGEMNLLIDANREILDRARTQVGNLAHALKTPLSVIFNEAEASQDPLALKVREQVAVMRDQIQYYLDRARAAAVSGAIGGMTDIEPCVTALIRTFEKIYRDKHLDFDNAAPEKIFFRGEKQDLEEMLGNLIDNACKWAVTTVKVDARVTAESGVLEVVVEDDGPGLPDEALAEVLQRGRRLDESKPGSGLGLSIVVDLAKLYRGGLLLDRSDLGGLRATLRLPSIG